MVFLKCTLERRLEGFQQEIKVPLPIKVQVDNVGAIWLANNSSVSERTKHVDLRAHFVRDMIKDQVIEINFVKSAENDSES